MSNRVLRWIAIPFDFLVRKTDELAGYYGPTLVDPSSIISEFDDAHAHEMRKRQIGRVNRSKITGSVALFNDQYVDSHEQEKKMESNKKDFDAYVDTLVDT